MNYPQLTLTSPMDYLTSVNRNYLARSVGTAFVAPVLESSDFRTSPGGKAHHHNFAGGLAQHTAEVVYGCLFLTGNGGMGRNPYTPVGPDIDALLIAAFWHDFMKTEEYVITGTEYNDDQTVRLTHIEYTDYMKHIGHVVGSVMAFTDHAKHVSSLEDVGIGLIDDVQHIMLAHHGRREWGSPVEPMTPEAYILHAADMLSARS